MSTLMSATHRRSEQERDAAYRALQALRVDIDAAIRAMDEGNAPFTMTGGGMMLARDASMAEMHVHAWLQLAMLAAFADREG